MLKITLLLFCVSVTYAATCKDKYPCAKYWPKTHCTNKWKTWMKKHCPVFCGHCSPTTTTTTTTTTPTTTTTTTTTTTSAPVSGACKDKYDCAKLLPKSYCTGKWKSRMKIICPQFCGYCSTTGVVTDAPMTSAPVPQGQCGQVKVATSRVVGGTTAREGAWPWQGAMYLGSMFGCGASLVNRNWVVTAAHCVFGRSAKSYRIVMGVHNRFDRNGYEQIIGISRIIVHPQYNKKGQNNNDIALMRLSTPAQLNNRVQPVCLPKQGESPAVGSKCYITGWGRMVGGGRSARILQQLPLTIQDNGVCDKKNNWIYPVTKNMICAANPKVVPNQSGCHGDSGGPFVCRQKDGSWKLHGAVSWGSPKCNSKEAYSVFARVGQFRTWIDQYINN